MKNTNPAGKQPAPAPRLRLPLGTVAQVRAEMARLYREAKAGQRDVSDASKLGNLLALLARLIEASDLEQRLEALENAHAGADC